MISTMYHYRPNKSYQNYVIRSSVVFAKPGQREVLKWMRSTEDLTIKEETKELPYSPSARLICTTTADKF